MSDKLVSASKEVIENWLSFPLPDDDEDGDFEMSDAQQEHALAVQRLVPRLARLRTQLCPGHMSESLFWKMYFVRIYPKLGKEGAMLLSTSQLMKAWVRAMLMEHDNVARDAVGVTNSVLSFVNDIARYPKAWLDYLHLGDDVDDFIMWPNQRKHALAINHLAPKLAALRLELCPAYMSEGCFWKIYFVYLHPALETEDSALLSTSQILNLSSKLQQIRGVYTMRPPFPQPLPWIMVHHDNRGRPVQSRF